MNRHLAWALLCLTAGCVSVERTRVTPALAAMAEEDEEAIGVVQGSTAGCTLLFHFFNVKDTSFDEVLNDVVAPEAKAMGATRFEVIGAESTPRHGVFAMFWPYPLPIPALVAFPSTRVTAVAFRKKGVVE